MSESFDAIAEDQENQKDGDAVLSVGPGDALSTVLTAWEASNRQDPYLFLVHPDSGDSVYNDPPTRIYGQLTTHPSHWGASQDLEAAREVQERLLPVSLPNAPGWDFAGRYVPAGFVGGDYWSVKFHQEENIITCKLADVTGHGLAAAILVAAVKFVSGVLFRYSASPAEVMSRTNHSLLRETAPDKMATMAYGWLYPDTGRARLVNAGHFPAFICRADGTVVDIPPTGPLLGLVEANYDEWETVLLPGDFLLFCSDGIAEASSMGPPRGDEHVKSLAVRFRHSTANAIADQILTAARPQDTAVELGVASDDMSLVIVKRVA